MKVKSDSRLAIFDTFKTKENQLTGEAHRQREIIAILANNANPVERTRTSISQKVAKKHGIAWKNIYSGIFRDLDEILIPLEIVEEDGRLPLKRGPKALQEKGIPHYHLTKKGMIVAISIKEVKDRELLLRKFYSILKDPEKKYEEIVNSLTKYSPNFIFSIFEKYVKAFCDKKIDLLPFDLGKLKDLSDESLTIQKELLEAAINFSKKDNQNAIKFLDEIS